MSRFVHIASAAILLCSPAFLAAQEDEISLGDAAREARRSKPVQGQSKEQKVIDNDNFAIMMDKAESARLDGKPVFSIDPSGKSFRITSPDGTCSLSFNASATSLISAPYVTSDLPQDELLKLVGPGAIHDDALEVALHNGTGWELKEIVVGLTVLQARSPEDQSAKLAAGWDTASSEKLPDTTVLYHLKGTGAPDSTTVFRGTLSASPAETPAEMPAEIKDWHWAIVAARGIPPANPNSPPGEPATSANSVSDAVRNPQIPTLTPNSSNNAAASSPLSSNPQQ